MSNTGGPFSDPYGSSSGASNPYGGPGANNPYGGAGANNPYDTSGPAAGGSPSPYGGIDQGPYTNPAQAAPSSGGEYADPYGGGTPSYQPPGAYGPPGGYASGGYGGYPPVMNYQNAAGGWSLGLGIAALVLCFVPVLTQGIAIAAIITGVIGRKAVSEGRSNNGGMAVAGIIIGAASLLISIIAVIVWLGTVYRL